MSAVTAVFEEGRNRQRFEALGPAFPGPFLLHIGGTTRTTTLAELKEIVCRWHDGFGDFRFDLHAVVASDDRAAVHATLRGIHDRPWSDLEPTGRSIAVEHMFFFRFEDDRIAEVWELLDRSELHRQLTGE